MFPEIPERILISTIVISLLGMAAILFCNEMNYSIQYRQDAVITQPIFKAFDALSKEQKLNEIHRKCVVSSIELQANSGIINELALSIHSKNTKYFNKAIALKYDDEKGHGLIVNKDVSAGDLLFVEYPLLKIDAYSPADSLSMVLQINRQVKSQFISDCEFAKIWDGLEVNPMDLIWIRESLKMHGSQQPIALNNMAKVFTNQINGKWHINQEITVYGLMSKINFGLPQNVAMIAGGSEHKFVCIALATKDIAAGTELVRDYFLDWFGYEGMRVNGNEFKEKIRVRNIQSAIFTRGQSRSTNGIKIRLLKKLNSNKYSAAKKYKMATKELYPNGIIGKTANDKKVQFVKGGNESVMVDKFKKEISITLILYKHNSDESF